MRTVDSVLRTELKLDGHRLAGLASDAKPPEQRSSATPSGHPDDAPDDAMDRNSG